MMQIIRFLLADPLMSGLELDDPSVTQTRRSFLRKKKFLSKIYQEWYQEVIHLIPVGSGSVLELGSGAGFIKDLYPQVIQSEIFWIPGLDIVLDGCCLPFEKGTLKAILMVDVLHHIPDVRLFFAEASRCLMNGGKIIMVEPWVTSWSRLVYEHFHHEPFLPDALQWEFSTSGPLSGANGALPWIIFERDQSSFVQEFPNLCLEHRRVFMPFRYLISGGMSMRNLSPDWSFEIWKKIEKLFEPWMDRLGMFVILSLLQTKDRI